MPVVVEFSVLPIGVDTSVGRLVAEAIKVVKEAEVKMEVNPTCTVFEASNIEEALKLIAKAHEALFKAGALRVVTTVRVDDRRDVEQSMERMVSSVKKRLI